jgi:hypothetical protein
VWSRLALWIVFAGCRQILDLHSLPTDASHDAARDAAIDVAIDALATCPPAPYTEYTDQFIETTLPSWGTWTATMGSWQVGGGALSATAAFSGDVAVITIDTFSLQANAVVLEFGSVTTLGTVLFNAYCGPGSQYYIDIGGGTIDFYVNSTVLLSRGWSSTGDRWLRMTEAGGKMIYETSPDGATWTNATKTGASGTSNCTLQLQLTGATDLTFTEIAFPRCQ